MVTRKLYAFFSATHLQNFTVHQENKSVRFFELEVLPKI